MNTQSHMETGEAGVRGSRLAPLDQRIADHLPDVTSLLATQRGQVVFERYYLGTADEPRELQSVTKSIVSLLVGIALKRKVLHTLEQPVLPLLNWSGAIGDPRWPSVTFRHLLTMTGGLPSELTDPTYDDAWFTSPDPVGFVLTRPLLDAPGTTFRYSNAGAHLLGAALAGAAGMPLAAFAQHGLFNPLGIPAPPWSTDPEGRALASGGLFLTSRDLLKIGHLTLQDGQWHGEALLPSGWVREMTRPHLKGYVWMEGIPDYGLMWWAAHEEGTEGWYATGYGGQYLAIFPARSLVVVMTGRPCDHPSHRHIIPSLVRLLSG